MAYLADWRITLAADLLRETDDTVGTIARKVGYANAFALSVAFKRLRGTRPVITGARNQRSGGPMRPAVLSREV
ncbi:helix-turn-helix domain-containing protein [Streptomyces sp. M10(2022)]